jgi:hypothetical protein
MRYVFSEESLAQGGGFEAMTAQERTDKLCEYFDLDKGSEQAMEIEKAIEEAEREASTKPHDKCVQYAEGFHAAQEKAAGIADSFNGDIEDVIVVSERIRAMGLDDAK